ncbi:Uncharacterised protein [Sphingobacterium spiritivorum]|uniref:Uncharacterized protein n=1 Tax=Sphingobacterium spiritivorum TaxID=258 RepID=A0A380C3G8_SPHSI|nr:Uncharacterised protein [Sphingobacterium spiritivorum]SUJ12330.1 Uncharacterised protein [Sphingobacterium spiritivorum]
MKSQQSNLRTFINTKNYILLGVVFCILGHSIRSYHYEKSAY